MSFGVQGAVATVTLSWDVSFLTTIMPGDETEFFSAQE
jgi:hypothetical protein